VGTRVDGLEHIICTTIQVLANFVAEWKEIQTPPAPIKHETWIIYSNSSVMKEGAGVSLVFILPLGVRMEYLV
jgi:hypothetical protein